MGVAESVLSKVVAGKRAIDAELALQFATVFDVPAEHFLELQQRNDLATARRVTRPNPALSTRAQLYGSLPIAEMIKRGWLDATDVRDVPAVEASLAKFFEVDSVAEIPVLLPHAAKKTNVAGDVTPPQHAWLYRVKHIASEMLVPRYAPATLRAAVEKMRELRVAAEATQKVPRLLSESGVRFLIVETLSGAKIDGVTFWLNDFAPVIALSCRFDRVDNFWFVLRHEIEHVLRRHGKGAAILDSELEGERAGAGATVAEEEREANTAAAEFCVSQRSLDQFIARKAPFFAERDLLGFSRTLGVHPGLVAGQIQRRTGKYDRFRSHLVKVRSCVAPSAIVDGWGDVAPVGED